MLSDLRHSPAWSELKKARYAGLEELTIRESARQFLELQRAMSHQKELAEPVVRPLRMKYLCELQERLASLDRKP